MFGNIWQKRMGMFFFTLFRRPLITAIKRQSESPVPSHYVEFEAYGPELMGITLLVCGLDTDIFGRKQRELATKRD